MREQFLSKKALCGNELLESAAYAGTNMVKIRALLVHSAHAHTIFMRTKRVREQFVSTVSSSG